MLSGKEIRKSFGDTVVFSDVDIDIAPGELAILTGPSGSGKSTLLRCLSLLDKPDKGCITIDNISARYPLKQTLKTDRIYPMVTCVFQQQYLWPHLTSRENIMLPIFNVDDEATGEFERLVSLFQMGAFIDKYPNQSSLGQRQRVSLARALMLNATYLLLDEVTSALDSDNQPLWTESP